MDEKVYIIGPIELLKTTFPQHDFSHARTSLDGTEAVIEEDIASAQDHFDKELLFMDHAEAVEYLNDPEMAGVWYVEVPE